MVFSKCESLVESWLVNESPNSMFTNPSKKDTHENQSPSKPSYQIFYYCVKTLAKIKFSK